MKLASPTPGGHEAEGFPRVARLLVFIARRRRLGLVAGARAEDEVHRGGPVATEERRADVVRRYLVAAEALEAEVVDEPAAAKRVHRRAHVRLQFYLVVGALAAAGRLNAPESDGEVVALRVAEV